MNKKIAAILVAILLCTTLSAFADAVLKLPSSLTVVAEEAFYNCSAIGRVEISEGTLTIETRAFAYSTLQEISLPDSVSYIADDAFEGCTDLCIEAEFGSYAYRWAQKHDFWVYDPYEPDSGDNGLGWG